LTVVRSHIRLSTWMPMAAAPGRPPPNALLPALFRVCIGEWVRLAVPLECAEVFQIVEEMR